jgi:hypothetical protein
VSKKKTTVELSARESRIKKSRNYMVREVADKDIDYSDIPALTDEQMRQFKPVSKEKREMFKQIVILNKTRPTLNRKQKRRSRKKKAL